ncbi:hypothetical protein EGJ48_12970, partial [Pantoea dispersa]|uniref:substrate-binding domain-containing protein n=1 Tax=Pantoea dispersa TaxID=59814 RepID=UPI000FBA308E
RVSSRISLSPYYLKLFCQYGLYVTLTVITRSSQQQQAAAKFVKYLQSDKARSVMQEKGLTPY